MGAYFGPAELAVKPNWQNPKGFWERKDIRKLNDDMLFAIGTDWDKIHGFSIEQLFATGKVPEFQERMKNIVAELDGHSPWVAKEPRFCLLLPLWLPLLAAPVIVTPYRSPLEVAQSLQSRNGIPVGVGLALWEKYTVGILNLAEQRPHILISFRQLIEHPLEAASELLSKLQASNVNGLSLPDSEELHRLIEPALYRHRCREEELGRALSKNQQCLWEALTSQSLQGHGEHEVSEAAQCLLADYEAGSAEK